MKQHKILLAMLLLFLGVYSNAQGSDKTISVLITDGQNNRAQWPKTTHMLKTYLEERGLFKVAVQRSAYTWKGEEFILEFPIDQKAEALENPKPDPNFSPEFSKYDVIISNFGWNAADWTDATQKFFEDYIENGGGLVVFHAADNSFPKWEVYTKISGLGGWGDCNEKDGRYVYYNDEDEPILDTAHGNGGEHDPQSEYQIEFRNTEHPITKRMPPLWMHTRDELYTKLRGPAENTEILGTAYAHPNNKGTGRHEPALMTLTYGKGRIIHNIMGHANYSVACVGLKTTMLRGTEWGQQAR